MTAYVRELTAADQEALAGLWAAATARRRSDVGLPPLDLAAEGSALDRAGAFGVGVIDDGLLVAAAVALPALGDDARSMQPVVGLCHISTVATAPDRWGRGLGRVVVRAVMSQATRRGYPRAQLWTHASNVAARRLYESDGLVLSGREKLDDFGEPIVHFVGDLAGPPPVNRPAARVLCLDSFGRILLLHWRDPCDGHQLWEPPGGGLEAGESASAAALREWAEETGLPPPQLGASTAVARDVWWNGTRLIADEVFFLARSCEAEELTTGGHTDGERAAYLGHAWVPWRELASHDDPVEPDLLPVLGRLAPTGPWSQSDRP